MFDTKCSQRVQQTLHVFSCSVWKDAILHIKPNLESQKKGSSSTHRDPPQKFVILLQFQPLGCVFPILQPSQASLVSHRSPRDSDTMQISDWLHMAPK